MIPYTNNKFQRLLSVKNTLFLPAGTYFVGDISYPLGDSDIYADIWASIEFAPGFFRNRYGCIVVGETAYGDGLYSDTYGRMYDVISGTIGISSMCFIEEERNRKQEETMTAIPMNQMLIGGHCLTFDYDFSILFEDGCFEFYDENSTLILEINTIGLNDIDYHQSNDLVTIQVDGASDDHSEYDTEEVSEITSSNSSNQSIRIDMPNNTAATVASNLSTIIPVSSNPSIFSSEFWDIDDSDESDNDAMNDSDIDMDMNKCNINQESKQKVD
jgi:hypothetical protein